MNWTHTQTSAAHLVARLLDKSEGNFLYVRQALDGLESGACLLGDLEHLPPGLYGLYDTFFRRQFGERGERYERPRQVLEVIVAAREPLTLDELSAASGLHARRELPSVMAMLGSFCPARTGVDGRTTYRLFHKSLADWLTADDLLGTSFSILVEDGELGLAEWCRSTYQSGVAAMPPYVLRYAVQHLIGAAAWDDLEAVLMDVEFWERRNSIGQIFELALDIDAAVAALPPQRAQRRLLQLLGEALRREIHFINRHAADYPQALLQCLWNAAWWFDSPQAAEFYEQPTRGWPGGAPPWEHQGPKLYEVLERWRGVKEATAPGFAWCRSLRPPLVPLGSALQAVLRGHEEAIECLAISANGRVVASGSFDSSVRLWDTATGQELMAAECQHPRKLTFSHDGGLIAARTYDAVRVWDTASGQDLQTWNADYRAEAHIEFAPDGRSLVVGHAGTIIVWDAAGRQTTELLRDDHYLVAGIAHSPDGKQIAAGFERRPENGCRW